VGIPWGEASCLEAMAYAEYGLADYTQSLRHFAQALRIAVKLQLSRYIATESFGAARTLAALGITAPALDLFAIAYRYYMGVGRRPYYLDLEGGTPPDMLPAVEERARTIDPEVAIRALLVEITSIAEADHPAPTRDAGVPLTERELEILERVARGMSNRDVAEDLFLSPGTVKWYLNQIYSKLGVNSRTQAVARARDLHLVGDKTNPTT
jgi:LuxR family maltose regulon positive regulatory protein